MTMITTRPAIARKRPLLRLFPGTVALFAIAAAMTACRGHESPTRTISAPGAPVILISIDTLRSDHLPAYGYTKVETPNIDSLRKDSILFTHAYAHVPLTLPSHASILTGLLPPDNGVRNNIGFRLDVAKHPTLASLLKAKGYATGAAISAYVLRGNTGLSTSFDLYDDDIAVKSGEAISRLQRPGGESEAIAERWIDQQAAQPFFFMLHLYEPHTPYEPPEPFKSRYASPYDGEIAAADAIVGKFLDHLKQSGLYDRAIIVLLSDHGEGLNEHGEDEHGIFLYREDLQVPLILKLPKSEMARKSVDAPVQLIDVFPTITALTGIDNPPGVKGRSLIDVANAPGTPRRIYGETLYPRIHLGWSDLRSMIDDRFHYIDAPRPELYAVSEPAEKDNVVDANRRAYAELKHELEPFPHEMPQIGNIDPEEAKKLAALGYLSGSSSDSGGPLPDPKDRIGDITLLKKAGSLQTAGQHEQAIAAYREVLANNPRFTDAWTLLARELEGTGRYDEAIETYRHAIQLSPSLGSEFSLSLANLYLLVNKPDEAAANAQLGLKTNPGNAHIIIGRAALSKGDLAAASSEAQQAMSTFNYKVPAMVLQAQTLAKQGRLQEAAQLADSAAAEVQKDRLPVPPLLYYVRGDILARMNQMPQAIEAFNEEIRRFPRDRQAYASLAVIYILAGRRGDANATLERLVAANPERSSYELAVTTFTEMNDRADAELWRRRVH